MYSAEGSGLGHAHKQTAPPQILLSASHKNMYSAVLFFFSKIRRCTLVTAILNAQASSQPYLRYRISRSAPLISLSGHTKPHPSCSPLNFFSYHSPQKARHSDYKTVYRNNRAYSIHHVNLPGALSGRSRSKQPDCDEANTSQLRFNLPQHGDKIANLAFRGLVGRRLCHA